MQQSVLSADMSNEVAQKMGRNLLLCQQIESALKSLLSHNKVVGSASAAQTEVEKPIKGADKQTLGQSVGKFVGNILYQSGEITIEPEESNQIHLSFSFRLALDSVRCEELQKALVSVVAERNDLVHQLHHKFDLNSTPGACKAIQYLDRQYTEILPTFDTFQHLVTYLEEIKQAVNTYLTPEAFGKYAGKSFSCQPPLEKAVPPEKRLMILLEEVATQKARPDGWVMLSVAAQTVKQSMSEELAALKKQYTQKTFQGLVVAIKGFEVCEEATANGGKRVLYRKKPKATKTT